MRHAPTTPSTWPGCRRVRRRRPAARLGRRLEGGDPALPRRLIFRPARAFPACCAGERWPTGRFSRAAAGVHQRLRGLRLGPHPRLAADHRRPAGGGRVRGRRTWWRRRTWPSSTPAAPCPGRHDAAVLADRSGLLLGDGVAAIVWSPTEHALARVAPGAGPETGFGVRRRTPTTSPSRTRKGRGIASRRTQACGGPVTPPVSEYVNAHGTGDPVQRRRRDQGPACRAPGAGRVDTGQLDEEHHRPHAGGGRRGGVRGTLLALLDGVLPPTAGFTSPDPTCDLDYVHRPPRPRRALSFNARLRRQRRVRRHEHREPVRS